MPLGLLIIGTIFLVAAVRGKHDELFGLLKDDFTGPNNFIYWGLSIFLITAVGYFKPLRPISNAFLVLVALALFISNRGFFNQFMSQIGASTGPQLRDSTAIKGLEVDIGSIGSVKIDNPFTKGLH